MHYRLCQPLQLSPLCPPPAWQWVSQNTCRQACFWTVRGQRQSQNHALPLQQWALSWQHLPTSMPRRKAATLHLWGKHPLPKWHHQASHLRPLGKRVQAITPRPGPLARGGPLCLVAICLAHCCAPSQQRTSAGGWHIEAGAFQLNLSWQ